jgi:DNA-binding transcriptional ArsR family regulator
MAKRKDNGDPARVFRALSIESRVRIVQLLSARTLCVGALSSLLGISAGAVSQHLRILKDVGLVEPDRRGYFIHYSLAPDAAERCRSAMESLFGSKEGAKRCAAARPSARGRRS